jgi:hypothetical protein
LYKLRKINLRPRSSPRKKPSRNFCIPLTNTCTTLRYEIKVGVGATYVDYIHKYMINVSRARRCDVRYNDVMMLLAWLGYIDLDPSLLSLPCL